MAEQGRCYTAIIRPLRALPVVVFMWKVTVWDKVLGLGSTDALTGDVALWSAPSSPPMWATARWRRSPERYGQSRFGQSRSGAAMSAARPSSAERLAILEQKVSHVETELSWMSAKVDEMHGIIMQAKGVR